ncbi:MAG: class I SAM-dependent methyltransferase [Planctomycetaceae bacterium]|nr:MAG: class I SAM-dependent methyltransferase [Planctomycetaceae bacterium]
MLVRFRFAFFRYGNERLPPADPVPSSAATSCPSPGSPESTLCWEPGECAICGSREAIDRLEVSHLIYGRRGSVRIVRCRGCGHLYQSPRPTLETISAWYPDDYGPHQEVATARRLDGAPQPEPLAGGSVGETALAPAAAVQPQATGEPRDREAASGSPTQPWYLSRWARAIPGLRLFYYRLSDRHASPVPSPPRLGAKALELGCGAGAYLEQLRAAGWEVRGVEPADAPASRCRARGLAVDTAGVESIELPEGEYDLVVAWMVLEHLHDPAAALSRVHRWLRPGGTLMVSVPHVRDWELRFGGRYHFILNEPTHLQHFDRAGIERLLTASGFRVRSFRFQQNVYNQVGWLGIWLKARLPGRDWGGRLLAFLDDPAMWGRLALAPLGKILAALGLTGRVTIIAERGELVRADLPKRGKAT